MTAKANEAKRRKLGTQAVKSLPPREVDYVVWDEELKGFGVRVWPSGKKTFIAFYRFEGAMRKVTLGVFGTLTADQARSAAKEVLSKAALGTDVAATKAAQRAQMTVSELCDAYLAAARAGKLERPKKASTLNTDAGRIERHIKPLLGTKKIGSVTKVDMRAFKRAVANGETATDVKTGKHGRAIVEGGEGTATRTLGLLGGIFSWAVDKGYLDSNPRTGVKGFKDKARERYLTANEFKRLGATLTEAATLGLPSERGARKGSFRPATVEHREAPCPQAVAAIRLLLTTGCRLGEILTLRWQEVDLGRGVLNLADSKTGAKRVLLGAAALKILSEVPRVGTYVIAGADPKKPRPDIKRPLARIMAHAGLDDVTAHTLRHSFASIAVGGGLSLHMTGRLLGHADPKTTMRYAHVADDPHKRAADVTSNAIEAMLAGKAA